MKNFAKAIGAVNGAMMWVCGIIGIFLAVLITADIIMRTMKMPIQWAFEMSQWLSATMALLGGGYALLKGSHVKIDLLYKRFSLRSRAIVDIFTSTLFYVLCLVLIWYGSIVAFESFLTKATTGAQLDPPMYLVQLLVPVGGLLIGLQGIVILVRNVRIALTGQEEKEEN
jgi:TRAP-type mannitol/chloroaromatic compound transport system permease small subunit